MTVREVKVRIFIRQKDVTKDLEQFIKSVRLSNVLDGETDTAEIELQDREHLFLTDWFPSRGDVVSLIFEKRNWKSEGDFETFDFSDWEIDEVTNSFPPSVCKIKLNSISTSSEMRQTNISRSWEKVKLSKIAGDLAQSANLELVFQAEEDPEIERAEQKQESNLSFLHKLARQNGLILRVSESQLILVDEFELEKQSAVITLSVGDQRVKSFNARATISEIYDSSVVNYTHSKGETISANYSAGNRSGQTLQVNRRVSSQAEAEKVARRELRDKNKDEIKIQLDVIGEFEFLAGNVIELDETFGFYAGNYIIERADWQVGNGFNCSIDVRKCLNY